MNRFTLARLNEEFMSESSKISMMFNTLHFEKNAKPEYIEAFDDEFTKYQIYLQSLYQRTKEAINDETNN